MRSKKVINILNLIGFFFLLYASYIFGQNGNSFSTDDIQPIFSPAPYAFSIWGLIYLTLFIWIINGFLSSPKNSILYKTVGLWFPISMILTGLSVLVPLRLTAIFIVAALISSLITYKIIAKVINENSISSLYRIPFSLLNGWLSVATIVNISLVLKSFGVVSIFGIDEVGCTVILLITGTIIALLFTFNENDIIFPLVFIWGYIAIIVNNPSIPKVIKVAYATCVILAIAIIYNLYIRKTTNKDKYLLHINIKNNH